ncbi:hypothetical protein PWT90_08962 [Aphanocladium album]|nr:hypothetical protein PWT90_08962 [Aphanocladium album]
MRSENGDKVLLAKECAAAVVSAPKGPQRQGPATENTRPHRAQQRGVAFRTNQDEDEAEPAPAPAPAPARDLLAKLVAYFAETLFEQAALAHQQGTPTAAMAQNEWDATTLPLCQEDSTTPRTPDCTTLARDSVVASS